MILCRVDFQNPFIKVAVDLFYHYGLAVLHWRKLFPQCWRLCYRNAARFSVICSCMLQRWHVTV